MNSRLLIASSNPAFMKRGMCGTLFGYFAWQSQKRCVYWLMAVVFTSNMVGCAAAQNGIAVSVADTEALFSQLEELAPPTIMLKRLECRGGRVIVAGESDTLSAVSGYMLKIDHAGWKPSLNRIERHDKHQIFLLTVRATREDDVICSEGISKHQNL